MYQRKHFIYMSACSLLLSSIFVGCGNKGPIYLPDETPEPTISLSPTTPPAAVTTEDEIEE